MFRPGGQILKLDLENGFYDVSIVEASHNCNWASGEGKSISLACLSL